MSNYWLFKKGQIKEQLFQSELPLLGPLQTWFRNNISTTWYVRPLLLQQNDYNHSVAEALEDHENRLIAQDQDQVALSRQIAELTVQMKQMNQFLQAIDQRLARLETNQQDAA